MSRILELQRLQPLGAEFAGAAGGGDTSSTCSWVGCGNCSSNSVHECLPGIHLVIPVT